MLLIYWDYSRTNRVKDLMPNIMVWCYLHGEGYAKKASEAVFFAEIFLLKRRL